MRARRAQAADVPAITALERRSPNAAHWSRQQYRDLLLPSAVRGFECLALVVEDESQSLSRPDASDSAEIVAFLIARHIDSEWELENIVVAETNRRRGVGTLLMRQFFVCARRKHGSSIFLEVRESNREARSLYQKLGFEETGLRRGYFSDPAEDAVLCRIRL